MPHFMLPESCPIDGVTLAPECEARRLARGWDINHSPFRNTL